MASYAVTWTQYMRWSDHGLWPCSLEEWECVMDTTPDKAVRHLGRVVLADKEAAERMADALRADPTIYDVRVEVWFTREERARMNDVPLAQIYRPMSKREVRACERAYRAILDEPSEVPA